MAETIPQSYIELFEGPVLATFTTIAPNGQPENTIVWCSWDGQYVLINTAAGRRKHKNVLNNPRVAVTLLDPADQFHWVDVRGVVAEIVDDVDNANIDAHARKYSKATRYYGDYAPAERQHSEKRIVLKIRPERVLAF